MTKITHVIIAVMMFTLLAVLGVNWRHSEHSVSAKSQSLIEQQKLNNFEVKALKIAEMKKDGDFINVLLKNVSDKEIDGLTLLFKDNSTLTVDYTISGNGIPVGQLKELRIPSQEQNDSVIKSFTVKPFFEIVAVVFTDRTEEGDSEYILAIKDRRRGLKSQLEKLLPELEKISEQPETISLSTLQKTRQKILILPEKNLNQSHAFEQGLNDGKEDLIKIIKETMNQQNSKQSNFERSKEFLKEKIGKIKDRINRL